jgi:hypothetical protein
MAAGDGKLRKNQPGYVRGSNRKAKAAGAGRGLRSMAGQTFEM